MKCHGAGPRNQRRTGDLDNVGIIPVLARGIREVEAAVQSGWVMPSVRTKLQVVALLAREERARVKADGPSTEAYRAEQLKRLDGIGTILAKSAARDTSLLGLLTEDAVVSDAAKALKRDMLEVAGLETVTEEPTVDEPETQAAERRVVPRSVISRQLANPFMTPDFSVTERDTARPRRLSSWEMLGPLLGSFEYVPGGAPACMALPEPTSRRAPGDLELMVHQAEVIAAAAAGPPDLPAPAPPLDVRAARPGPGRGDRQRVAPRPGLPGQRHPGRREQVRRRRWHGSFEEADSNG